MLRMCEGLGPGPGSGPGVPRLATVIALTACLFAHFVTAHREHKVHNIVLYPEKHSWCKTTPIKQVVAYPGCTSQELDNNVCVGACFSYSIPVTSPSAPGQLIQPYCDSCQPAVVTWQHVSLVCEGEDAILERVQMIENCSCSTCGGAGVGAGSTVGEPALDADDVASDSVRRPSLLDVPELMELMMETHNTRRLDESTSLEASPSDPSVPHGLPEPMVALLKTFSLEDPESSTDPELDPDPDPDPEVLKDLLKRVQGADHRVNQVTLAELVRRVEHSEHILVDVAKLKRTLARLVHEEAETSSHELRHQQHAHHEHGHHEHGHHEHGHQKLGHQELGHQELGHQKLGHQELGHQELGHQKLGHQELGHQELGHQKLGHQELGHQELGHQKLGHQELGHQKLGHHEHGHHEHGHQDHGHQDQGTHQKAHEHGYQVDPSGDVSVSPQLLESHVFNERGGGERLRATPSGPVPPGLTLGLGGLGGLGSLGLDPTLDVSPHHLKPALAGSQVSYHENIVMPEREELGDEDDKSF